MSPARWMPWAPGRGDVVWVRMALTEAAVPTEDLELPERRPALVLSPAAYSAKVGLAVLCPIAGQAKGYPFEVELSRGLPVHGVVLADRVTSLDWRSCGVRLACTASDGVVVAVQERLMQLLA